MAKYDEAQVDYREFANITRETGKEISGKKLKIFIVERPLVVIVSRGRRISSYMPFM